MHAPGRARAWLLLAALAAAGSSACLVSLDGITGGVADAGVDASDGSTDSTTTDSTAPGDVGPDSTVPQDSGTADTAPTDAACVPVPIVDGGAPVACPMPVDAGDASDDAGPTCPPVSLTSFTPHWTPPRKATNACGPGQVTAFINACFNGGPAGACNAFEGDAGNTACVNCMESSSSLPEYGPIITDQSLAHLNRAGCIALADPCNLACAQAVEAVTDCENKACAACPLATGPDIGVFETCTQAADNCSCVPELNAANTCGSAIVPGPATPCFQGSSFQEGAVDIGVIFCGGS